MSKFVNVDHVQKVKLNGQGNVMCPSVVQVLNSMDGTTWLWKHEEPGWTA